MALALTLVQSRAGRWGRTILRQAGKDGVTASLLKKRFALSDAETAIALSLAAGLGLLEISEARGVTLHTIRSQLKSIFHKTGARSQARLVALVLRAV